MPRKSPGVFSREFKLAAVRRMAAGELARALSQELQVPRRCLYAWRALFGAGGEQALRPLGRPRKSDAVAGTRAAQRARAASAGEVAAAERVAELERKIGQQQVELDFFRQALRQVKATRQPSDGLGVRGSIRSWKR